VNPYRNRGPIRRPEDFFGRERELTEIRDCIAGGASVSLIGERRVGKSSILNALRFEPDAMQTLEGRECVFVFVDCQYFGKSPEAQVLRYLLDALDMAFEGVISDTPVPSAERSALLHFCRDLVRRHPLRQPVLLMDEIDVLANNQVVGQEFFAFLRAWSQQFQIPIVTASKEGSIESLVWNENVGSPFWNIFKTIYIGPFTRPEATQLIREPARGQGVEFSAADEDLVRGLGGHHPFFLQIACDCLFQARCEGADPARAVEQVDLAFRQEALPHLDYLLRGLPEPERQALLEYATSGTVRENRILAQLVRKGIFLEEERGLRLFSSALASRIVGESLDTQSFKSSLFDRARARFLS
jgi:hypothetical protein